MLQAVANNDLTARQRLFIGEFLKTGNATQAATKAGYGQPHVAGSRLLGNVRVKAAVEAARLDLRKQFVQEAIDAFRVMLDLMKNSSVDIVRFQAARDLLDRAGYRPVDRREVTGIQAFVSSDIDYANPEAVSRRLEELRERRNDIGKEKQWENAKLKLQ